MKLNRIYIFAISFLVIFPKLVNAQENDFKYSLGGFVELDHHSFFKEKKGKINSRNQNTVQLELKSNLSDSYSFFSSVEFRNDFSDPNRNRVYLKETYIDLYSPKIDLRVGKQVILWGKADGFNPTSNIIPIDYSDILDTDDEEIGIFALKSNFYYEDWEIQGIISPTFQSSIFPSSKSRWQNYPDFLNHNGISRPARFTREEVSMPENKFKDFQYGLRLSRNFNNVDFSISYYQGWNDIPNTTSSISFSGDTINVSMQSNYYKHQVIGGDFSWVLGKYILKGEGALFLPQGIIQDDPYFQYVIGFERVFSNIIDDKNLFVIAQWIHEIKSDNIEYKGNDFNHLFQRNLMTRIEMDINRDMKFSVQAMYSLKYEEFYIKPEFIYNISDGLNFSLMADFLGGNKGKDGFFSNYSENNRVRAKLKYNF